VSHFWSVQSASERHSWTVTPVAVVAGQETVAPSLSRMKEKFLVPVVGKVLPVEKLSLNPEIGWEIVEEIPDRVIWEIWRFCRAVRAVMLAVNTVELIVPESGVSVSETRSQVGARGSQVRVLGLQDSRRGQ